MSTHTPGEWLIEHDTDNQGTVAVRSNGLRSVIARCYDQWLCDEHGGSIRANAALIAAAPAMLEALKSVTARCEAYYGSEYPATKQGHAAIRLAEGKG